MFIDFFLPYIYIYIYIYVLINCDVNAFFLNYRPVSVALTLNANMQMIGKRFPYYAKYEVKPSLKKKITYVIAMLFLLYFWLNLQMKIMFASY